MELYELENLKRKIEQLNLSNYSKRLLLEVVCKAERHHKKVQGTLEYKHSLVMTLWNAFKSMQDDKKAIADPKDKVVISSLVYEFAGRTLVIQYEAGWIDKTKISPKKVTGFMQIECLT